MGGGDGRDIRHKVADHSIPRKFSIEDVILYNSREVLLQCLPVQNQITTHPPSLLSTVTRSLTC